MGNVLNVDPVDISATHLIAVERAEWGGQTVLVYTLPYALLPSGA